MLSKILMYLACFSLEWQPGYLDIYHFSTGRGNAAFFMMPDGTTMLVDAGETGSSFGPGQTLHIAPAYPNDSLSAGEWISAYIKQLMPVPCIDYAVITHFHADHYGNISGSSKLSSTGKYRLSGITTVGEEIPIKCLIDRGDGPVDSSFLNYLSFVKTRNIRRDTLHVGATDQIKNVLGIKSGNTVLKAGRLNVSDENSLSLAFKLSYGKFDYYTGGDNNASVEIPIAAAVGKVDVCTFDHHGNRDAMSEPLLKTLAPRVLVQQSWCSDQPGQELVYRLISEKGDVFATYIHPETKITYGAWFVNAYKSMEGHVIIRVLPGGAQYFVIVAETVEGKLKMKAVYGPYNAE